MALSPSETTAIIAIAISSVSLYVSIKERRASHRNTLYQEQLQLIKQISPYYGSLLYDTSNLFLPCEDDVDEEFISDSWKRLNEAYEILVGLNLAIHTILPVAIVKLWSNFYKTAGDLFLYALKDDPSDRDEEVIKTLQDNLFSEATDLSNALRNYFGIGTLTVDSMQVIGTNRKARAAVRRMEGI